MIISKTDRNKIISFILAAFMALTVFASWNICFCENVSAFSKVCKITSTTLKVRSNAGTSYKKIGTVKKNEYRIVRGTKKDSKGATWYKIKYGSKTGYIHSSYTKLVDFNVTSVSGLNGTISTNGGNLTIRSGPGTIFASEGTIPNKKTVKITAKAKDVKGVIWYRFTYKDNEVYGTSKYIKTSSSSTSTTTNGSKTDSTQQTTKPSTSQTAGSSQSDKITYTVGIVNTSGSSLNVRGGAGTSYSIVSTLSNGATITIKNTVTSSTGAKWYSFEYAPGKTGYVSASYVTAKTVTSDDDFEAYMNKEGFPESYKAGLRMLHIAHPNWTFKAYNVGTTWANALKAETKNLGTNVVSSSVPTSYRSKASGAYNSKTGTYTKFDGSWYAADKQVVAYYMDPRNFLDENGIYQFMTHQYDSSSQNATTVKAVIKGSFMETRSTGTSTYKNFAELISAAGKEAGVNPNVIAAMIIQEQGTKGTSGLISGTYSGYKGYYNFFNIGAYTTSSMSAVQRGLWYAKQSGSYARPWNSIYKSIKGGAMFYGNNYVSKKQDNYYYKKFNVKNGLSSIGTHQYMTHVSAAASEGKLMKAAFSANSSYSAIIEIPVYNSMPTKACSLP